MPRTSTIRRRLAAGITVALAATGAVAVVTAPGRAQGGGTTIVLTPAGREALAFSDVAPKGFRRNRFSLGDRLYLSTKVKRDGAVVGTSSATVTVTDRRPVNGDGAHGDVTAVYHLDDGDIDSMGTVVFNDAGTGEGAVVGGTGAYTGARGTVEPGHARDVIHLLP